MPNNGTSSIDAARKIADQFVVDIREIIGLFSDASMGFGQNYTMSVYADKQTFAMMQRQGKHVTQEWLDTRPYATLGTISSRVDSSGTTHYSGSSMHVTTSKEHRERNKAGGKNERLMGNLAVVMIYSLWEHTHRQKLEAALGEKARLDIFGDLAQLRHCILKNRGMIGSTAERKLKLLKFTKGEVISLNTADLEAILGLIGSGLTQLLA